jgi:hypothetical protein
MAQLNIAMADATIGIWNAKNTYNFWRPITAIQATMDPTWAPLLPTPSSRGTPPVTPGSAAPPPLFSRRPTGTPPPSE